MIGIRFGVLLALVVLAVNMTIPMAYASEPVFTPAATGITLIVNYGNGTTHEYSDLTGSNVYEVTNSTVGAEGDWYGNLVFVTSISGVSESDETQQYWHYKVNGELGRTAANVYILQNDDSIEWVLSSPNTNIPTTPVQPDIDYSLIVGAGTLGAVSILVLIVLWAKRYRG